MVLYEDAAVCAFIQIRRLIGKKLDDDAIPKSRLANKNRQQPLIQNIISSDVTKTSSISQCPSMIGLNPLEYKGTVARIGFDKNARSIEEAVDSFCAVVDRTHLGSVLSGRCCSVLGSNMVLATVITRPIEILRDGARPIRLGSRPSHHTSKTNDELRELADDFNTMAQEIGRTRSNETGFRFQRHARVAFADDFHPRVHRPAVARGCRKHHRVAKGLFIRNQEQRGAARPFHRQSLGRGQHRGAKTKTYAGGRSDIKSLAHEMGVLFKPAAR